MTIQRCYVGLGSNLGTAWENVQSAVGRIGQSVDINLTGCSKFYRSAPWGGIDQPDFVNAVASLDTSLGPHALLRRLLTIESDMGRRRRAHWGSRIIDLDLLLQDDEIIATETLIIPHPLMHRRAFVLVPLLELAPDCRIPGKGRADRCLQSLDSYEVEGIIPIESGHAESLINE